MAFALIRHKKNTPPIYVFKLTGIPLQANGVNGVYGMLLPGSHLNPLLGMSTAIKIVLGIIYQPGGYRHVHYC